MTDRDDIGADEDDLPYPPLYGFLGRAIWIAFLICIATAAITFAPAIAHLIGGAVGYTGAVSISISDFFSLFVVLIATAALWGWRFSIKRKIQSWKAIALPGTITAPMMVADVGSESREVRWAAEIVLWLDSEPLKARLEEKMEEMTGILTSSFRLSVRELGQKTNRKRVESYLLEHNQIPGLAHIQMRNFRQQQVRRKNELI